MNIDKSGQDLESLFDDNIEGDSSEFTTGKRLRDSTNEDDLFDNDLDIDDNSSQRRRLKKKKKGPEQKATQDDEIEIEGEKDVREVGDREKERDFLPDGEKERGEKEEEEDGDENTNKPVGSKQLQSELFADDSDSENIVSGSELPNDFPDDLSEDEIIGIQAEERAAARRDQERQAYVSDEDFSDEERLGDFVVDAFGNPVRAPKESSRRLLGSGAITSEQLVVAHDIFGDYPDEFNEYDDDDEEEDNQLSNIPTNELRKESYKLLAKRLEPSELEEHFVSVKDDEIVAADIPERHQLRIPSREVPDDDSITREAEWIYDMVFKELKALNLDQSTVTGCIKSILKFILVDNLEIPFIATYRKEHWNTCSPTEDAVEGSTLILSHLWEIYDWDEKWYHFQNKKNKLKELYTSVKEIAEISEKRIISDYIDDINHVIIPEQLNDYLDHFRLHFSELTQNAQRSNQKLPSKNDKYSIAKKVGITEISSQFGITPREFAQNLEKQVLENKPKVPEASSPYDAALTSSTLRQFIENVDELVKVAESFNATEIAAEPFIRQFVRSEYPLYAVINTRPTEEGKRVIDPFHIYRDIKHLVDMPINEVTINQVSRQATTKFAKIMKAAKDGLITYTVDLQKNGYEKILNNLRYCYIPKDDPTGWNTSRENILAMVLNDHLFPLFRKELTEKLSMEGQQAVVTVCESKLEKLLLSSPFRGNQDGNDNDEEEQKDPQQITVLACCYGNYTEQKATECVLLTPGGEYKTHLTLAFSPKTNEKDCQEFRKFIEIHNPTVIAIGTNGYSSRHLYADLMSVLRTMKEEGFKVPHASWVDSEIAEIYWSSKQAI